eukprot:97655_1
MSFRKDSFNDEELTMMAEEITQHFNTKANHYETDSNNYLCSKSFNDDISSMDDEKHYTLPSISYFSSPTTDDNTFINYPSLSPKIVSESKLSSNDSFNISVPSIPSSIPIPKQQKQAINGWSRNNKSIYSTNHNLPYISPPSYYHDNDNGQLPFINDIASCISPPHISPRKPITKQAVSQIPNFCPISEDKYQQEKDITITTNKYKHKKKKKRKCHKCKCKHTLQCVLSPIIIDFEKHNFTETKYKGFLIQPFICKNERVNKKRNKNDRLCSLPVDMNGYMVENGFMVVANDSV